LNYRGRHRTDKRTDRRQTDRQTGNNAQAVFSQTGHGSYTDEYSKVFWGE